MSGDWPIGAAVVYEDLEGEAHEGVVRNHREEPDGSTRVVLSLEDREKLVDTGMSRVAVQ